MKLLPRLYNLEDGVIRIDDYDIQKVDLDSLRQQIGIVPQDSMLFDGSVRDNIAMNAPDATDEEVIHAASGGLRPCLHHGSAPGLWLQRW